MNERKMCLVNQTMGKCSLALRSKLQLAKVTVTVIKEGQKNEKRNKKIKYTEIVVVLLDMAF